MTRKALLLAAALAPTLLAALPASATTIVTSLAAFRAGTTGRVTTSANPGNYDLGQLFLPTTSAIALADGNTLSLSNAAQVTQPQNGFPYDLADGFAGELFVPQDANGNNVSTETITFGSGISALGFEIAPYGAAAGAPNFGVPGGPYSVSFVTGGQTTTLSLPGGSFTTGTTQSQFFGFVGGGVTSITIRTTDTSGLGFGNFVDVPEPASLALLAIGLAGAVRARRRAQLG